MISTNRHLLSSVRLWVSLIVILECRDSERSTKVSAFHSHLPSRIKKAVPNQFQKGRRLQILVNPDQMTSDETEVVDGTNQLPDLDAQRVDEGKMSSLIMKLEEKIGKVDDDRIIFPELDSGEVSRMFSSLQYTKSDEGAVNAVHATGSILGATALVAGTVLGGGVLALPAATASVGFLPSVVGLCIGWFYTTMSGLIIAELSMNRLAQTGQLEQGLLEMYEELLGDKLSKVGSAAFFFMNYAVMAGYISYGGQSLESFFSSVGLDSLAGIPGGGETVLATACALGVFATSSSVFESINNILLTLLAATTVAMIGVWGGSADFASLIDLSNQRPELLPNAFPVIFLTLMFQGAVPQVVKQLEGDRRKITASIIAGTTLPGLAFLAWNAVVLGNVPGVPLEEGVDPLQLLLLADGSPSIGGVLVGMFSSLAVVTSLISFSKETVNGLKHSARSFTMDNEFTQSNVALSALCFLPPLAFAIANPDVFSDSLNYAGAFGVSTFFLVLPPIMAWGQRYGEDRCPLATKPIVPFGKLALGSMWKAAGTLIVEQGAERLGLFEWFSQNFLQ